MLLTRNKLRHIGTDFDVNCPFCKKDKETINRIFINYDLASNIWSTIKSYCLHPNRIDLKIIDWLGILNSQKLVHRIICILLRKITLYYVSRLDF